ncbi:iron-containing alcohol dehydrogenase [Rhizobium lusitanum]|nr:iron-containing alcohol dehydrogenase [Rhizobium lusitanum]
MMLKFEFKNPTRIVFGEGQIAALRSLILPGRRVFILYGGGSIKRNGVYDQVVHALAGYTLTEFGGIEVNPHYETILRAAEAARTSDADLILAVGGGSVIDAAKFLASAVTATDRDPWDNFAAGNYPREILPIGCILTLPATGSESNAVSVISSTVRNLKIPFANEAARPTFAIMDPSTMASLDKRQLGNGVVDAFTHVVEQYLTVPGNTPVQYGFSEVLLRTLIEWGPKLLDDNSPEARENVMWAANQALNGLIGAGVSQDWSTHMIGHAITALYGLDHARTLSLVMPSLLRFKASTKQMMLARYGRNVWGVTAADDKTAAEEAIDLTEDFFHRMGLPVKTADIAPIEISTDDVVAQLQRAGHVQLGEMADITPTQVREILAHTAG